ncbi:hypothetical protein HCN44_001121 [Aphidius gifuensis]|uniref:SKP1-like protein n=1 Tax=Aphidius gifuensis TaxID=684658 RepID=A0A835CNW3_APHGI|nr:S-phase kinase-associated protein 1-like [Aphidius gifuensis]KAF7988548.1 hypothetical protein HCN44_001121 [Aphidius gifuensis]
MAGSQGQTAKVILKSEDGISFLVDYEAVKKSKTLEKIMNEIGIAPNVMKTVNVPNVPADILRKIIQYIEHYKDVNESDDEDPEEICLISNWDKAFLKVDETTLFRLLTCAHYMEIKGLIRATSKTVAQMIMNKTPDQIRERFGIENDIVEEVQAENDHVENVQAENDHVENVQAENDHVENVQAENDHVENVQAENDHVENVQAENGHVENVQAEKGHVEEAQADNGHVEDVQAEKGHVEDVQAEKGHVEDVQAEKDHVEEVQAEKGHVENDDKKEEVSEL